MKKIILQVKNLNIKNAVTGKLYNVSTIFFESYIYSLSGLDYSGRDIFLNILKGDVSEKTYEGSFIINGHCVNNTQDLKDNIYTFSLHNKAINDWTVAEYIGLREGNWLLSRKNREDMTKKVGESLNKFGLSVSGDEKIGTLSELKRYQIEIVRADLLNGKIIIIEDDFENMKYEDIKIFSEWLKSNSQNRMTVILNTYSKIASYECADIFICFKKGCIVKMCSKDSISNIDDLDIFVIGNSMNKKINNLKGEYSYNGLKNGTDEVYSITGNIFTGNNKTYSFSKGKIYSLIIPSHIYRYNFFEIISGIKPGDIRYFIDRYEQKIRTIQDLINKKIIAVDKIGDKDSLVENMSVEDNLLLPSLNKISSFNYLVNQEELGKAVFKELKSKGIEKNDLISELDVNKRICVALERWIIFRPRVFIIYEPFIHCDNYGLSLIKSYIKKFAENGCTVIIIKSRTEYVEDISDEKIYIS